ncbi:DNA-binding NarL/FixJ family response regulator [Kibdelosporangium banguiense]|uniref:DNA-binding NarL/FixJ family response regulator n=1 Tax=Kibdelosporangium banguiense TaxID=1365924 RepID=A0ABS4TEE6_9PSEU|nr:DNA-binding NarL/FixJ family response regulator [Kibdelosporangium banguiense]
MKVFVSAILRRLDVPNRVRAAIIAYEAGLVDL